MKPNGLSVQHPTLQKIREFQSLDDGWHFGKGNPPDSKTVHHAMSLATRAIISTFDTDAFPGIDGEIMVTVYHKQHYLEFTIESDMTVTFVHQVNDNDVEYQEGLTFNDSLRLLDNFSENIWNTSGLSTRNIMIPEKESSKALHSKIHHLAEYLSYRKIVLMKHQGMFAHIFSSSIPSFPQTPKFTGVSLSKYCLMDASLSHMKANPETSVMGTLPV
jgi:hypothetical protein